MLKQLLVLEPSCGALLRSTIARLIPRWGSDLSAQGTLERLLNASS